MHFPCNQVHQEFDRYTALVKVELKDEIIQNVKGMVYAHSGEEYEKKKNAFLTSAEGVKVRVNKKYVSLHEQFLNNWDTCTDMWVSYHRRTLPTLGDSTNNRVERSFWTLKESLQSRFPRVPVIQQSIVHHFTFCDERIRKTSTWERLKSLRIYDTDKAISALNHEASLSLNSRGCKIF